MTALRSWNQGVSWVAFTLTKHIQYSRLTHVSCVGVMDQYLLIRATLCVASLKIWWASWARVIIAVFSVNHASGARSPLTAGPRRTDEPAERQTGDTQTERQVRPASGDFVKHWWMGYYDDTTSQVLIPNQFCINKSLFWVLPSYTTSLGTPTSTYLKFNPCRHPWIVLRLSLK